MSIKEIQLHTKEQHADALARFSPPGELFAAKFIASTTYRQLLTGLACEFQNAEGYVKLLQDEFIPDNTIAFIEEWEKALGIPDDCFDAKGTIAERRRDILAKLASLGVQTAQDFEDLALLFGFVVNVTQGEEFINNFPYIFPITFPTSAEEARFIIVVEFTPVTTETFPYTFPLTFSGGTIPILECLFNKLKPANCQVIFKEV